MRSITAANTYSIRPFIPPQGTEWAQRLYGIYLGWEEKVNTRAEPRSEILESLKAPN